MSTRPLHEAGSVPHLLIIEDSIDEIRLLIKLVRSLGYRISLAFDGAQGYQRAQALQPDLILLDVHMPILNGFDAGRLIRSDPATAHIPIIYLTSASHLDDRLEGLGNGGVDYVIKPFDPEEVLARIRIHLALNSNPSSQADVKRGGQSQKDLTLVNAACAYLDSRLALPPTRAQLAQVLHTNEKRLTRAFRRERQITVFEYIRQQRLNSASRLLRETSLSITQIAEELGFSTSANFSTAFKAHFGVTPSAYRTQQEPR